MTNKQLTWQQRGALWLRLGIRLLLGAAGCFLILKFGRPLLSLFAPFVLALITAALLNPLVKSMQRALGWNRQLLSAVLLVFLFGLAGGGAALLIYAAVGQAVSLVQNWSGLLDSLQAALNQLEALFAHLLTLVPPQVTQLVENAGDKLFQWLYEVVPDLLANLGLEAGERAMGLPSFLIALIIFVMAAFMLTADYPYLRSRTVQHMDEGVTRVLGQLKATALGAFGGYLKAELLLSVGVFFILLAGFFLMRQPYGLLLALGLAVMDFIPVIGAGTVMVPWAFVALFTRDFSSAAWLMAIWGIIALFRRVMEPKFVGDQTGLSPILSLVSIYVGMKLAGVVGMILGPVVLLILLNLAGMGLFQGLALDLKEAARDIAAILSERPDGRPL
ncbi:MAG: sporulation integral membrane protein YtvI [Lawsonibacter sp.]|nr:sporulation integral membrane protein YtvI [Lawsonibacter sp.]